MNTLFKYSLMDSQLKAEDVRNELYRRKNLDIPTEYLDDVLADLNIDSYEINEYDYNELEDLFYNLFR